MGRRNHQRKQRQFNQSKRRKKEYSKVIVAWCFAIITFFIFFACYESYKLSDPSPIGDIADIIKYLAVAAVGGYFIKSRSENKLKLQIQYQREASELKKKYGDNYVQETLEFDDLSG